MRFVFASLCSSLPRPKNDEMKWTEDVAKVIRWIVWVMWDNQEGNGMNGLTNGMSRCRFNGNSYLEEWKWNAWILQEGYELWEMHFSTLKTFCIILNISVCRMGFREKCEIESFVLQKDWIKFMRIYNAFYTCVVWGFEWWCIDDCKWISLNELNDTGGGG